MTDERETERWPTAAWAEAKADELLRALAARREKGRAERPDVFSGPHVELWGLLCPDCGPGDKDAVAAAALAEVRRLTAERDRLAAEVRAYRDRDAAAGRREREQAEHDAWRGYPR